MEIPKDDNGTNFLHGYMEEKTSVQNISQVMLEDKGLCHVADVDFYTDYLKLTEWGADCNFLQFEGESNLFCFQPVSKPAPININFLFVSKDQFNAWLIFKGGTEIKFTKENSLTQSDETSSDKKQPKKKKKGKPKQIRHYELVQRAILDLESKGKKSTPIEVWRILEGHDELKIILDVLDDEIQYKDKSGKTQSMKWTGFDSLVSKVKCKYK